MVLARVVSFSYAHGVVGKVHITVVTCSVLEDRLRAWRQNGIFLGCIETYRRVEAVSRDVQKRWRRERHIFRHLASVRFTEDIKEAFTAR